MRLRAGPVLRWARQNVLLLLTLLGVVGGIAIGGFLRYAEPSARARQLIGYPGELFMNMLKMMILPLICSSLIFGLSQVDGKTSGKVGSRALIYYAITTTHAVIIQSSNIHAITTAKEVKEISALDKVLDLIRNMFPENIIRTMFSGQETRIEGYVNVTRDDGLVELEEKRAVVYVDGMNILGLIVFCITMGIVIGSVGEPAKPLADLFRALDVVITKMVGIVLWVGPVGIASLIAEKMLRIENIGETAAMLGMYVATVTLGLLLQCFVTLPIIYVIGTRQNPYIILRGLGQAILNALGTSSSAATLPITFQCLNRIGIDPRITKFVLPVGSVVNMDGTALYEAVASIFIAQMNGRELSIGEVLTVSVTATLAAIGAAAIPSGGLVTLIIVLTSLGLPAEDVSMIITVDWLLSRMRAAVNIVGDSYGCGFVYHLCKDDLDKMGDMGKSGTTHGVDLDALALEAHVLPTKIQEMKL